MKEIIVNQNETIEREIDLPINDIKKSIVQHKIDFIKQQLADMDYKNSKYLDGEYTEEQWAEIQAERKKLREEIRKLEAEL